MLRQASSVIVFIVISVFFVFGNTPANAEKYGLLIGVSSYPSLEKQYQLKGPRNDVLLMEEILIRKDFKRGNLQLLADGIEDALLPTRQAIIDAINELIAKVNKDDYVYLHFSGHGSQQPQSVDSDIEVDGLDEIILPRDTGKWNNQVGTVENAITDGEIGSLIDQIRSKGAFVWAVFDSCHSGTLLRGAENTKLRYRIVDPSHLGIPQLSSQKRELLDKRTVAHEASTDVKAGYVAFYASQASQLTPELSLPKHSANSKIHGAFTYSIGEILARNQVLSYRQAANGILQKYAAVMISNTTPLFTGTAMDAPLLQSSISQAVLEWPLILKPNRYEVNAGKLNQMDAETIVGLFADSSATENEVLGYMKVIRSELFVSEVKSIPYLKVPIIKRDNIPEGAVIRLIKPATDFTFTVAKPAKILGLSQQESLVTELIEQMLFEGKEKNTIKFVNSGDEADIRLAFLDDNSGCPSNHLWMLQSDGIVHCAGRNKSISISLNNKNRVKVSKELTDNLSKLSKFSRLLRLAEYINNDTKFKIKTKFSLFKSNKNGDKEKIPKESLLTFVGGEKLHFSIENASASPVDVTILFVDGDYGITTIFPYDGEANRIDPYSSFELFSGEINQDTVGTEYLIAIAVQARKDTLPADFSYLSQQSVRRTRSNQSAGKRGNQSLSELFSDAGFTHQIRRGPIKNKPLHEKATMEVISLQVGG